MRNRYLYIIWMMALFVMLAACGTTSPEDSVEETSVNVFGTGNPIVIGDVSSLVDETTAFYQPLADYMAENLQDLGITNGVVRVAPNLDIMAQWLANGEVDIYIDSLYPSVFVSETSDSRVILRHWRGFVEEYYSVFFVLADSDIASVDDLQGDVVAYDHEGSTSGFFLPTTYLIERGFNPVEVTDVNTTVNNSDIGYIFADGDINIVNWVIAGRVNVGATNNIVFEELPQEVQSNLRIIAETASVPSQVVSISQSLSDDLATSIVAIMSNMESTEAGQQVLRSIRTTRFDALPIASDVYTNQVLDQLRLARGEQ